ncbi:MULTISPECIES: ATP-binding protein [unclassified Colwellia]|uniref:ATP-binding protein n=1 Tax=unclassified Colwellia TaxID=196834 RepID=UPI0015F6EB31|nr:MULTISPECIES: ATP-binding protein [unclassified Colwellia]MBA6234328.1 HAMP domain-containing protein [Colwellia sp. MB02u-7]MBA6237496.1 HAMP domain-containing protein [Colwellia sp. MB02u-11]MBA6256309.1 HAMP domain-containing protein [Colwellia sp. MB3u-28]MBA6260193.1 HAMP domain-containing protein [Colwellia sp. MB3u-41]MBA6300128.1 HAMP domain-containing protein [Colwellia sp. MB3u-22]
MITKIRRSFSSIGFKIFLWFWLFALSSIIATRFISAQLAENSIILPAHPNDQKKLNRLANRIESKNITASELLRYRPKISHDAIIIKDIKSGEFTTDNNPFLNNLVSYLEINSFPAITSIQFPRSRITGPKNITLDNKPVALYLVVKGKSRHFNSFIMQLPNWLKLAIPIAVSSLLAWLLARTLSKPILAIRRAATDIGNGQLDARIKNADKRKDELGSLATSFNTMADKLSLNLTANQRLLADVSHELRSPMTRLQLAVGLAQQSINKPELQKKHLARCELEVTRLNEMISDVLSLSRLENTFQKINLQTVHLDELLTDICQDCQYIADEKHILITMNNFLSLDLLADQNLLSSAFSNVIINAIKYSPKNSEVIISMHRLIDKQQNSISIIISDNGTGVPQSTIEKLFQPFYRVDEARDRNSGGTGLGLAIAQQAVLAHNGKISAKNKDSGGLSVRITLPLT